MFTPYSLIPATAPAPNVLGQLSSGTNTAPFGGMTLGAGQTPIAGMPSTPTTGVNIPRMPYDSTNTDSFPTNQPSSNLTVQDRLNTLTSFSSSASQNSTNTPSALTTSQSGQMNSALPSTTTRQNPTLSYITEANRALNMPTNSGQVMDILNNYARFNPAAPSTQQLQSFANNLTSAAGGYQQNASTFGNLYADLVEGRISQDNYVSTLQRMQELSRQAAGQWNDVQGILSNSFLPTQTVPGMGTTQNTLGLAPAQRFTLPQETWNMSPQELTSWIQSYERRMGRDSFLGNAAWIAGPALIGGAAAMGLTGITSPLSLTNSIVSTGIENLTGMNSR